MEPDAFDDADDARVARAANALRETEAAAEGLSVSVGANLRRALEAATLRSGALGDSLRRLGEDMARSGLRAAIKPLTDAAASGLGQAAGRLFGAASGALAGATRGFARGGVVDGPTVLGAGVAGEAGPEAILPLARGADGRLGVRGGGGRVVVNVTTPDAESFRRSAPQVAAALARAVARGQNRL